MTHNRIKKITSPILHIVFFWLKKQNNKEDRAAFEQAIRKLINTNQQAIESHLGGPAASEERDVVDNSFTYCYTMGFQNEEAQRLYQTDQTHLKFIKEAKHLWAKVRVHDSISI